MRIPFAALVPFLVEPENRIDTSGSRRAKVIAFAQLASRVVILLAGFVVLDHLVYRGFSLPESSYHKRFLAWECLRERALVLIPGALLAGTLLAFVPRLRQDWNQFEFGGSLRWFIVSLCAVLAWAGSAYAYNAHYDQFHLADRLILWLLALLVAWRPVFTLPFVAFFWTIYWQFAFPPLGDYVTFQSSLRPITKLLTLFSTAFFLGALFGGRKLTDFLFIGLCLVAANFWLSGLGKLRIGWITHGHLYNLFVAAYTHGWMAFLDAASVASIAKFLAIFDWPMRIGTLLIECGALLIFLHHRVARYYLVLFTVLLGSIFMMIGYLFWEWMILHLAFLVLIFRKSATGHDAFRAALFTPARLALSILIIGGAKYWFKPPVLAWFDTPVADTLRFEALGPGGTTYSLPENIFAPYDRQVVMGFFHGKIAPGPRLVGPYGVTYDRAHATELLRADSPAEILAVEARLHAGANADVEDVAWFDQFVQRTIAHSNRTFAPGGKPEVPSMIRPPRFFWTFPESPAYPHEEPIEEVRIVRFRSFFNGEEYVRFPSELVRIIEIQP